VARSRFRSVRYDLTTAIEVARLADAAGGAIGPDLLAPALGYSGTNNGAYLSRVASARLFGLVSGRGPRVEITERGRQILSGVEPGSSESRREAFLAVPLFRAVAEATESRGGILPDDLAHWLVDDFGETESKARLAADLLVTSAGQALLTQRTSDGKIQLTSSLTKFTSVDNPPSVFRLPRVRLPRGARSSRGEDGTMAEDGIWLDEEREGTVLRPPVWRRAGVIATAAVVLIVVAVPVALVADGSSPRLAASHNSAKHPQVGNGPAEHEVLSALSATTDSGNFDFSYTISSAAAPPSVPTTTSTTVCHQMKVPYRTGPATATNPAVGTAVAGENGVAVSGQSSVMPARSTSSSSTSGGGYFSATVSPSLSRAHKSSKVTSSKVAVATSPPVIVVNGGATTVAPSEPIYGSLPPGFKWRTESVCSGPTVDVSPNVQGSGIIDTSPQAMVASANIGSGLDVSVRVDSSTVYEGASGATGLAPPASDGGDSGTPIPGFANITEGTLGSREGAMAMMGMASPTGYLDLVQPAISAATQTGTGTVDGVPVTNYLVTTDASQLAGAPGVSAADAQTITAALTVLKGQGYTGNTAAISIDAAGFIRQVKSVDTFADGGTSTLLATFSNFGCAGTVLMPGQTGSGVPPVNCTSPDNPNSPKAATPTTSSVPPASKTSDSVPTTLPASATTFPSSDGSSTTTYVPPPTNSTTTTTVPISTATSSSAPPG